MADGWIVAFAHAKSGIVVTQEIYAAQIKNRIKIPNACEAFGVNYVNTYDMLRSLKIRL